MQKIIEAATKFADPKHVNPFFHNVYLHNDYVFASTGSCAFLHDTGRELSKDKKSVVVKKYERRDMTLEEIERADVAIRACEESKNRHKCLDTGYMQMLDPGILAKIKSARKILTGKDTNYARIFSEMSPSSDNSKPTIFTLPDDVIVFVMPIARQHGKS